MFDRFTHLTDNKSKEKENQSFLNFNFGLIVKLKGELLYKIVLGLLGGSVFASGIYSFYNNLPSSDTEVIDNSNLIEFISVERFI